jgi:hypothetical protein
MTAAVGMFANHTARRESKLAERRSAASMMGAGEFSRAKTRTPSHDCSGSKSPAGAANSLPQSTGENFSEIFKCSFL